MIKLYDLSGKNDLRFSPPCWTVKLCLLHKNIKYETVPVRFSEKDKIAFSGQTLVPILEHEEGYVNDSWEIIKWLDKNYPENKLLKMKHQKISRISYIFGHQDNFYQFCLK